MKNTKNFLTVTRFIDSAKGSNWKKKVTLYLAKS